MFTKELKKYSAYATIPLRLAIGIIFIAHGYQKLFGGLDGTATFFANVGIPMAAFFAVVVACVEFFGGIALVAGMFTRYAAVLLAIVMIVAIFKVKLAKGLLGGYELDLALLAGLVSLMLSGPGRFSVETMLFKKEY